MYILKEHSRFFQDSLFMRLFYLWCCLIVVNTPAYAFSCYLTIAKDNCWKDYAVTVRAIDTHNNQQVAEIMIPKGKSWGRVPFKCDTGQVFLLNAQFSPAMWKDEDSKMYALKSYLSLPKNIKAGEEAWNLTACYANDFAGLPLPNGATNNCQCDFSQIEKPVI